jgi:DNA-binding HxlR family transcriptional regulator
LLTLQPTQTGETLTKSAREIMEILESYDLTRCAHSAAQLAGCDAKTVKRYVALRDAGGGDPLVRAAAPRPKLIDGFLSKVEELVDTSKGKIRADKVHERLVAMGFSGTERTTRRAVRTAKLAWRAGRRRTYRPWVPEPGLWLQFDWGDGPRVGGRKTQLFCAWLAWSRFRVVIPVWDQTMGTLARAFTVLGKRWSGLVLASLRGGPAGFRELSRAVGGVSDSLLSDRLSELTELGLVTRTVDPGPPVAVSYELTVPGLALIPALQQISHWAAEHLPAEPR